MTWVLAVLNWVVGGGDAMELGLLNWLVGEWCEWWCVRPNHPSQPLDKTDLVGLDNKNLIYDLHHSLACSTPHHTSRPELYPGLPSFAFLLRVFAKPSFLVSRFSFLTSLDASLTSSTRQHAKNNQANPAQNKIIPANNSKHQNHQILREKSTRSGHYAKPYIRFDPSSHPPQPDYFTASKTSNQHASDAVAQSIAYPVTAPSQSNKRSTCSSESSSPSGALWRSSLW